MTKWYIPNKNLYSLWINDVIILFKVNEKVLEILCHQVVFVPSIVIPKNSQTTFARKRANESKKE